MRRVLGTDLGPQVVVSAVPLAAVVDRERRLVRGGVEESAGTGLSTPAAGDDLTATLIRIWSEVLAVSDVDPDDDFFDLGGNSLVAVQLIVRVREAVGVRMPMRALFEGPTVAGMAALVGQLRESAPDPAAATTTEAPIPRVSRDRRADKGES
jgi:acyl carrier protein